MKTTLCIEIQTKIYERPYDLSDPSQRDAFLAAGEHSDKGCSRVCGVASEVSVERLLKLR